MGWQDDPVVGQPSSSAWKDDPVVSQPSFLGDVGRQVGLTARAAVRGVSALPNMILDPAVRGINAVAGTNLPIPSEAQNRTMTRLGIPEPQGDAERIANDVASAMAGQGGIGKAAEMVKNLGPDTFQRVMALLSAQQKQQIIGAGGATGAAALAQNAGLGPVGQTVAAIGGGLAAPTAADATMEAAKGVTRGVRAAIDPFTQTGRQKIVGTTLRNLTSDQTATAENLANSSEIVPGSQPTTAQASRDPGLLIAERGIAASSPQAAAAFAQRGSQQNTARTVLLNSMAGDESTLAQAQASRDATTAPMREGAFSAKQPIDMAPVEAKIESILQSPVGKRETVANAMEWLRSRVAGITDPEELYAIRQDVGDVLGGKLQGEKANLRLASGQLVDVRKIMDDVIESGAPGFKGYLKEYAGQSRPIDQMEALQGLRAKVTNAGTDAATGENLLSAAKFSNAMRNPDSRAALKKTLTPEQFSAVESISADLDRAALSASAGKSAGSNTTQNLSTAYVLGKALGAAGENTLIRNLARPLSWLNKLNEPELHELLVDAMLNPGTARSLMAKATPQRVESLGFELLQRARAKGIGAAIGGAQPRISVETEQQ